MKQDVGYIFSSMRLRTECDVISLYRACKKIYKQLAFKAKISAKSELYTVCLRIKTIAMKQCMHPKELLNHHSLFSQVTKK